MGIVIVSDSIDSHAKVEGYLVRVSKIDGLLQDKNRTYLEISYRRNFFKKKKILFDNLEILKLNFFAHFFYVFWKCFWSDLVYVHSVHNLKKAPILLLFLNKMIVDLHGLVSEEVEHRKWLYKLFEKIVWRRASSVVCVTDAMARLFSDFYGTRPMPVIILPIYSTSLGSADVNKRAFDFVYSGGTQPWQCIDMLVETIKSFPEAKVLVLTPDIDLFEELLAGELHRVSIRYCTGEEYYGLLATANYGLILRRDNPLNRVACPTKLIEYLNSGIVPVMISQHLGDFKQLGMRAIDLYEFTGPDHFTAQELMQWRYDNRQVISRLESIINQGKRELRGLVE